MNMSIFKLRISLLTLIMLSFLMINCSDDDSGTSDEEIPEYVTETKANLVGEWILISSTINNENVVSSEFEILKQSRANFHENDTYSIVYKIGGSSTSTSTQEGTYTVSALNQVTFFNSTSAIKLIDNKLQITSTITISSGVEQTRVDIFLRSDSEELEELEDNDVTIIEDDDVSVDTNTYDGTAVIARLQGKWKISNVTNECLGMNTMEFKSDTLLEFIQHKKSFNRSDLLNYNLSVSYPTPSKFAATVTKGNETVNFDTETDCQFVKTSQLEFIVKDENTILIKNVLQVKILLENDNTFKLIYTYMDTNGEEKTVQFIYEKL